jgi:hypothetical protein
MKFRRSILLFTTAFALGLALAWARRERPADGSAENASKSAPLTESVATSLKLPRTKAALKRERDGFKSAAAWLRRIEGARASDFPDLFLLTFDAPSSLQSALTQAASSRWAELDPKGMLAYFIGDGRGRFPGNDYYHYTGTLIDTWARSDPEAALAATGHFANAGSYAWSVMLAAFRENPGAGIAMINEHANLLGDLNYVPHFFGKDDPASLFTAFADIENAELRTALFGRVAMGFMTKDPENAWRWWRSAAPELQREVADSLFRYGKDAGKFVTSEDLTRLRSIASETRDSTLAAKVIRMAVESGGFDEDVGTTLAWVRANVHGQERQGALASVLGQSVGKDPAGALAAFEALPRGTERLQAASSIARNLYQTDPAAALGWLHTQPPGEATENAFRTLAETWAKEDWNSASAYALTMPDNPAALNFDRTLAFARYQTSPAEGLAWSMQLGGQRFETVAGELIHHWTRSETADAMAFVNALPEGGQRNVLFSSMANAYYHEEGEKSAPWLATLRGHDLQLALKALDATGAPEDWKANLRAAAGIQP